MKHHQLFHHVAAGSRAKSWFHVSFWALTLLAGWMGQAQAQGITLPLYLNCGDDGRINGEERPREVVAILEETCEGGQ